MTDKEQLIYDLSMQCARFQVEHESKNIEYLPAAMLKAFTSAVNAYNCMSVDSISAALEELKKVGP